MNTRVLGGPLTWFDRSTELTSTNLEMSKRVLVASTIGAVAKSLGDLCEKHGGHVTYFEQGKSLLKQLIDGKYEVLMIELNFIEGEHRDLIARLRSKNNFRIYLWSYMHLPK